MSNYISFEEFCNKYSRCRYCPLGFCGDTNLAEHSEVCETVYKEVILNDGKLIIDISEEITKQ